MKPQTSYETHMGTLVKEFSCEHSEYRCLEIEMWTPEPEERRVPVLTRIVSKDFVSGCAD